MRLGGLVLLVWAAVGCGSDPTRSPLDMAASATPPNRFVFVDRPDEADLMACLGLSEALVVSVDAEHQAMSVRRLTGSSPLAIWSADSSFVDASLLSTRNGWIRINRHETGAVRAAVESTLGPSLSRYVFAEQIAADPASLAASALENAIETTEARNPDGNLLVTVTIDGSAPDDQSSGAVALVDLQFVLDGVRIMEIRASARSADEAALGFVWEYQHAAETPPVSIPTEVIDIAGDSELVEPVDLRRNICNLRP